MIMFLGSFDLNSNDGVFDARTIICGLNFFSIIFNDFLIIFDSCFGDFFP